MPYTLPYHPNTIVLHIPHASTHIPSWDHFTNQKWVKHEQALLTDWATDRIFDVPKLDQLLAPFSRIFCDVERLPDADEPMFQHGAGYYYTHTDAGQLLRHSDPAHKQYVWENFHQPHHQQLTALVDQKLAQHPEVLSEMLIVDCHSFSSQPLRRESQQSLDRPDICIGTDPFHTPAPLRDAVMAHFANLGYSVYENRPYAGTIVPLPHYQRTARVHSIMIEINKRLYMDEGSGAVHKKSVQKLQRQIAKLLT